MKGLVYNGPRDVRYESVEDPSLLDERGAIIQIEACAICGSDLHIYDGHGFADRSGFCVGHEGIGEVVEVGASVNRFRKGDRVLIAGGSGCGQCSECMRGRVDLCTGDGAKVFGIGRGLQGLQAEAAWVPAADVTLAPIPEGMSDEQALLLTDNLPTAYFGAVNADVHPGATVAVVGLGPVGLLAVESALVMGAERVFAVDLIPERRALAERLGAIGIDGEGARPTIKEATGGRMCDSVIEAVGSDATIGVALDLAGRAAAVSVIGVSQSRSVPFPMALAFAKGLTFRIGVCPVQSFWPPLLPLVASGRIRGDRVFSHHLDLAEGAAGYAAFSAREDGTMKVLLRP